MLTPLELGKAKTLYRTFFRRHPGIKNPSDINSQVKFQWAIEIGWESLYLMQRARKGNVKRDGYPYPWTAEEYWSKRGT